MVFQNLYVIVLWTKVASALEGLSSVRVLSARISLRWWSMMNKARHLARWITSCAAATRFKSLIRECQLSCKDTGLPPYVQSQELRVEGSIYLSLYLGRFQLNMFQQRGIWELLRNTLLFKGVTY